MSYACSFCGTDIPDDEKICPLCGTEQNPAAVIGEPAEHTETETTPTESCPPVIEQTPASVDSTSDAAEQTEAPEVSTAEQDTTAEEEPPTEQETTDKAEESPAERETPAEVESPAEPETIAELPGEPEKNEVKEEEKAASAESSVPEAPVIFSLPGKMVKKQICSSCGKEYPDGGKFCSECGGKIEEKMVEEKSDIIGKVVKEKKTVCSGCGKEYPDGGKFCPECGEKIEEKEIEKKLFFRLKEVKKFCCIQCGKEYPDGGNICGDCGGKIEETVMREEIPVKFREIKKNICSGCGREFTDGTRFCPDCGGKIEGKTVWEEIPEIPSRDLIQKYRAYEPEKALDILSDLVRTEQNPVDISFAYDLAVRLGKIEDARHYLQMLCDLADGGSTDSIMRFVNEHGEDEYVGYYEDIYGVHSSNICGYRQEHYCQRLIKCAESGDEAACKLVADLYSWGGCGFPKDSERAEYWRARVQTAEDQQIEEEDEDEDVGPYVEDAEELKRQAENGDMDAVERVANRYENGFGNFPQDNVKANHWYAKLHSAKEHLAESGNMDAIEWIADGYEHGEHGYPKDRGKALFWWEKFHSNMAKLAESGDAAVMKFLAHRYSDSVEEEYRMGYERDAEKEKYWRGRWENHLRRMIESGLPVDCFSDEYPLDILKLRSQKLPPSAYYARAVAEAM